MDTIFTIDEAKTMLGDTGWSTRELSEWTDEQLIAFATEEWREACDL